MASSDGCPHEIWLTAAFRTEIDEEKFIFMKKECALYKMDNHNKLHDKIMKQPDLIENFFPSLKCTIFADVGIDCAFPSNNEGKAFIFSQNMCAEFDYAASGGCDRIVKGPILISDMFPFLRSTEFESGIDAAFESINRQDAYLFKGNMCARISLASNKLITKRRIKNMFPILCNTMFENGGIDAAYAYTYQSYQSAVLLKGDTFCQLHFNAASTNGQIKWGPHKIKAQKPILGGILPRDEEK